MKTRSSKLLILITILLTVSIGSCINQYGIAFPSLNRNKKKRNLAPTFSFNNAMFEYRKTKGYWPKSEMEFIAYNRTVVNEMTQNGYEDWTLGRFSDDTLYVHWNHRPIQDGAHVGGVPIPYQNVYLTTRYIFSTRSSRTEIVKKKDLI